MRFKIPVLFTLLLSGSGLLLARQDSGNPAPRTVEVQLSPDSVARHTLGSPAPGWGSFLKVRSEDIRAGAKEPHRAFLEGLIQHGSLPEKVWALTRQAEAGDYRRFQELLECMANHVRGISKTRSGHGKDVLPEAIPGGGQVFRIHRDSPWWAGLAKSIREDPDRNVGAGLYALWCYNTRPSQRELIFEIASHIQPRIRKGADELDPWADPRFWIVMDWVIAWGGPGDFARMEATLPEGTARKAFARHTKKMRELPGFFSCSLPDPDQDGVIGLVRAREETSPTLLPRETPVVMEFESLKVKRMPPVPRYPEEARARGLMTRLQVRAVVDHVGAPCGYRPLPGPWLAFFAPTGVDFIKGWTFVPATVEGVAWKSMFHLTMPFALRN